MKISPIQSIRDYVRQQQTSREPLMQKSGALQSDTSSKSYTESLRAKLMSGQKLTSSELEYLKNHDPDLYSKAMKAAQDREAYESSLHRCRTKSELNDLHNQTLAHIIKECKNGDPEEAMMRVNAIQDAHRKFMQSDEYASLDWGYGDTNRHM